MQSDRNSRKSGHVSGCAVLPVHLFDPLHTHLAGG